jgi:hypothetical protein
MDKQDNEREFSGLSDLIPDARIVPQAQRQPSLAHTWASRNWTACQKGKTPYAPL